MSRFPSVLGGSSGHVIRLASVVENVECAVVPSLCMFDVAVSDAAFEDPGCRAVVGC